MNDARVGRLLTVRNGGGGGGAVGRAGPASPRLSGSPPTCAIRREARLPPGGPAAAGRAAAERGARLEGAPAAPRRPAPCSMAAAGAAQPQAGAVAAASAAAEESSDSEPEQEPGSPQKLIRKVSTSGQIRQKVRAAGGGRGQGLGLRHRCGRLCLRVFLSAAAASPSRPARPAPSQRGAPAGDPSPPLWELPKTPTP